MTRPGERGRFAAAGAAAAAFPGARGEAAAGPFPAGASAGSAASGGSIAPGDTTEARGKGSPFRAAMTAAALSKRSAGAGARSLRITSRIEESIRGWAAVGSGKGAPGRGAAQASR